MRTREAKPALVFMWAQFGAYHVDRLEAAAAAFGDRYRIVGIEVASGSRTYAWTPVSSGDAFMRTVLFPGALSDDVPWTKKLRKSMRSIVAARPCAVFLCNQEEPEIMWAALLLRALRVPIFAMLDAKFDDSPRHVLKEAAKRLVLGLYRGALVAGERSVAYYRFLGMPEGWARTAYDTVSIERVQAQAAMPLAPGGIAHGDRDFIVVARFVPKKNLQLALRAYGRYRAKPTRYGRFRRLVLCGSGSLEPELRALVRELGVEQDVEFTGFLSHERVAQRLGAGLALILPSIEEQWGLVVNEAVALGLPILCSDNVGARDSLVRVGVNGYSFETDNDEGLAMLMHAIAEDEALWRGLAEGSRRLAPRGDVAQFVRGVGELVGIA